MLAPLEERCTLVNTVVFLVYKPDHPVPACCWSAGEVARALYLDPRGGQVTAAPNPSGRGERPLLDSELVLIGRAVRELRERERAEQEAAA